MNSLNYSLVRNCLLFILMILLLFVISCSSSSDGSDGSGAATSSATSSGIFVDSPVSGLQYNTGTQSGLTDGNGRFFFQEGETVTFSIGDLVLGSGVARQVLTPVEIVVGAIHANDLKVINLCRLLQSLDVDGDPSNGIEIPAAARELLLSGDTIDFDQSLTDFGNDPTVQALLQALNNMGIYPDIGGRQLVSAAEALQHLQGTLAFLDLDKDGYTIFEGDCDDHDANLHPGAEDIPYDGIDQNCDGMDVDGGTPATCGEGTTNADNTCVPEFSTTCGAGTQNVDGLCQTLVTCGDGTINADNTCVPAQGANCPEGTEEVDGLCVPSGTPCPEGFVLDGETGACLSRLVCRDPNPCSELNRNRCYYDDNNDVVCSCNYFFEEDDGECVPQVPTQLKIYPDQPYADYIRNSALDWPDQYFRIQLFVQAFFADPAAIAIPYRGNLTWSSDNEDAASVDQNGLLETEDVVEDTTVTITVESEGVSGTLTVNVLDTILAGGVIISDNDNDLIHDGDYAIAVEDTEKWRCLFLDESGAHLYNLSWDALWISDDEAVSVPDMDSFQESSADVSRSAAGPAVIRCGIERGGEPSGYYVEAITVAQ